MNLYENQFSDSLDFPHTDTPRQTLVIASTGRCGSHMLGHALYETGKFGFPLEYGNMNNMKRWKERFGAEDVATLLNKIMAHRTSENGVFGIKIHYSHVKHFGGFRALSSHLVNPKFVLLSRENVLKQAVSLSIATQTGVWIDGQEPTSTETRYDRSQIDKFLRQIIRHNAAWRYLLAANGCDYIEMNFDEVRKNVPAALQRIAHFADVTLQDEDIPETPVTKKQSNAINEDWRQRFLDESDPDRELFEQASYVQPSLLGRIKRRVIG